jgi:hypothetical protein
MSRDFDIFMSHSHEDAEVIAGIKILLEGNGLSVYVDWIEDARTDGSQVTAETAKMLRERMAHCRFLLYASSVGSSNSKWMPWELGYFDGLKKGKVGILPIVRYQGAGFIGQEYLALYDVYEQINFVAHGLQFGRFTSERQGELLKADVWR